MSDNIISLYSAGVNRQSGYIAQVVHILRLVAALLILAACAPSPVPLSPLGAGAFVSPVTVPTRAARYRVALPIVEGVGFTQHCVALDTWAGNVAGQINSLGEGECFHVWFTPTPLPVGLWAACRSVAECERLDVAGILRARPGAIFLLLNEPQNPDVAGGGCLRPAVGGGGRYS